MNEEQVLLQWQQLQEHITAKTGEAPSFDDILLYIGVRESGIPPKVLSDREREELIRMATCTVLVPARYYELFWVEDTGWPHYKQLQRLPPMPVEELRLFLKPWIIQYAVKNRLI